MDTFETFKKCSNLTDEQTDVSCTTYVSCCLWCHLVYSTCGVCDTCYIYSQRQGTVRACETVVKRLSFGLIAVSVLYQLNFVMQLVYYYYHNEEYCKVNRFFSQYFGTIELLFIQGIIVFQNWT